MLLVLMDRFLLGTDGLLKTRRPWVRIRVDASGPLLSRMTHVVGVLGRRSAQRFSTACEQGPCRRRRALWRRGCVPSVVRFIPVRVR